jgi:hypothetical protein
MTYTIRGIPDRLWDDIKRNAAMSGIPIRKYILFVLESNNVKFKIVDPAPEANSEHSRKRKLESSDETSE